MYNDIKEKLKARSAMDVLRALDVEFDSELAYWLYVIECSIERHYKLSVKEKKIFGLITVKPYKKKYSRERMAENLTIKEIEDLHWLILELEGVDVEKERENVKKLRETKVELQEKALEGIKKKILNMKVQKIS